MPFHTIAGPGGGSVIAQIGSNYGVHVHTSVMSCCGLAQIYSIGELVHRRDWRDPQPVPSFQDKAEWLAELYKLVIFNRTVQYIISDAAERNASQMHQLLLEIGSTKVHSYPNLCHGPSVLGVWMFDIKNAVGKYLEKDGTPLKEAP